MDNINELVSKYWKAIILVFISILIAFIIYGLLWKDCFKTIIGNEVLSNILTVNGVFSAILITYIFTRISWTKEKKESAYKDAVIHSQKITEFRRITDRLIKYYNVWDAEDSSKNLLESSKYRNIDFYDAKLYAISDFQPNNLDLINELFDDENFKESHSMLFLAMASIARNRKALRPQLNEELHNDFDFKGIYTLHSVEKWLESDVIGTISYWLSHDTNFINFFQLNIEKDYILARCAKINPKFQSRDLNNKLISEVAEEINSFHLKELYFQLEFMNSRISWVNIHIISLISSSLIFGVLIPFILLLFNSKSIVFLNVVSVIASINVGLFSYFILRFPFMIKKEMSKI